MDKQVIFFNKDDNGRDCLYLIKESLEQIKMYYTIKKSERDELIFSKGDEIDFLGLLMSISDMWMDDIVEGINELINNERESFSITLDKFRVIKYIVDFYWDSIARHKKEAFSGTYFHFQNKYCFDGEKKIKPVNFLSLVH